MSDSERTARHALPTRNLIIPPARLSCSRSPIPRLGAGDYMRPADKGEQAGGGRAKDKRFSLVLVACVERIRTAHSSAHCLVLLVVSLLVLRLVLHAYLFIL